MENMENTEAANKGHSKYDKGGTAGVEGILFQVNLLTVTLFNAIKNGIKGWKLSTENKRYGKFDDVVLELSDGAILLQAKHRKSGKLSSNELFSVNSKHNDYSLGKYFFSYQEIKDQSQIKNVVICTNAMLKMDAEMRKFLNKETDNSESFLYHGSACAYYTFNDSILPKLDEHVKRYHSENLKNKNIDGVVTSENLKDFLKHLKFYCDYPSDEKINEVIRQLISHIEYARDLSIETSFKYIHNRVLDWFRQPQGIHLEECHVTAIISELRSIRYCEMLDKYQVHFEDTNSIFKDPYRILHVISEDAVLLTVLKIYRVLQSNKTSTTVLYVNPQDNSFLHEIVEAFEVPQYTHLIIICPDLKQDELTQISLKLRQILQRKQYKKVILVANRNNKLALELDVKNDIFDSSEDHVTFKNLSADTQARLLKEKNIVFQGNQISLEELVSHGTLVLNAENEEISYHIRRVTEQMVDSVTLEKLVKSETITIGSPLDSLEKKTEHYYVPRIFNRKITESGAGVDREDVLSEENIYNLNEKTILIIDSAGMGKTTVLTNVALTIKRTMPHLWVIKINLNDYTAILQEFLRKNRKSMSVSDLLESVDVTKFRNEFERRIFTLHRKVLLMLDGVDEISPDYTELILSLLIKCQESPNFAKIFATARLHMTSELEKMLNSKPFQLQPFTNQNQNSFLTNYWMHDLRLDKTKKDKCEHYAEVLIEEMTSWKDFAELPLHLIMLADIFKTSSNASNDIQFEDMTDWEGCLEFANGDEKEPKLPDKPNIPKLYKMFIDKKRDIFIHKGNPMGNAAANLALNKEFDECLAYHGNFAIEEILKVQKWGLFACYQPNDRKDVETNMLKIGIVQKIRNNYHFIHRTFAEYFLAKSLLNELQIQETKPNRKFQKFFIEEILIHYNLNVIRMFFDDLLQNISKPLPNDTFQKYQFSYKNDGDSPFVRTYILQLLHILAEEGRVATLEFILNCIRFKIVRGKKSQIPMLNSIQFRFKSPKLYYGPTLEILKDLVQKSGLNIIDNKGATPLHYAVQNVEPKMVNFLVERGVDVNIENNTGFSSLYVAVRLKHLPMIEYLLSNGADVNKINEYGETLLYYTAMYGTWKIFKLLVKFNADVNIKYKGHTVLSYALRENLFEIVKFLVANGADMSGVRRTMRGPLVFAASFGQLNNVKFLVEHGADINRGPSGGFGALHAAAERGHFQIAKFLVEKCGALVNVQNEEGCTPLHLAALQGHLDICKMLVTNGAMVNIGDIDRATALQFARSEDHSDVCQFLVECGGDIFTTKK